MLIPVLMTALIAALVWLALEVRHQRRALDHYAEATCLLARAILVKDPLREKEPC